MKTVTENDKIDNGIFFQNIFIWYLGVMFTLVCLLQSGLHLSLKGQFPSYRSLVLRTFFKQNNLVLNS